MPQSTASRGSDEMVYGPFRKVGITWDTSLQPLQTKVETFEILFPYEDVAKEPSKPKVREIRAKEMEIIVELWYLPAGIKGEVGKDQFLFDKAVKKVSVK